MPKHDYSTWLTKQQAAEAIGVSTKMIERMATDGDIQQARWQRPSGGPWISVYHPNDVERVRSKRNPGSAPFIMPKEEEPSHETVALATRPPEQEQTLQAFVAAVSAMSQTSQRAGVRTAERLFLTIPEAAEYSGLPQSHIRELMKGDKIQALKTGAGWRIRRADLERL